MKRYLLFFGLLSAVLFSACNSEVKKERLQRIDSLGVHLNYVNETLEEVDSAMLQNRINEIRKTSDWVYDNITDTLPKKPGLAFGDYLRTNKYLGQALSRYDEVKRELNYSERQVKTLRTDVENNFYSEEEFEGYFRTEAESVASLVSATDELKSRYDYSKERYNKFKPVVKDMVDSLKNVIYGSEPIAK